MSNNILLREVFDHYRATGLPALRGSANSHIILDAISRRVGSVRAEDFAATEWRHYVTERLRAVKPATLKRELTVLRCAWNAWGDGLPSWPRIKLPKVIEPEIQILGEREFARVLRFMGGIARDVVAFLRITACRRSEAVFATWGQVSLERRTLSVPRSKNGEARVVPLPKQALVLLYNVKGSRAPSPQERVFPIAPGTVSSAWSRAARRAGHPGVSLHAATRHSRLTDLARKGLSVHQIACVSGHRSLAMAQRYTHLRSEDVVDLLDSLGSINL